MEGFMTPDVYNHYKRPEKKYEEVDTTRITEQAGYIPAQVQIQQFINAGKRLNEARGNEYDWDDPKDVDMSLEDPTRTLGFDLADASELAAISAANLAASAAKRAQEAPVEEKATETPEGPEV